MRPIIFLLFLFFTSETMSKTIVISDIDDTIKTSNSMGVLGQLYHFLKMESYPAMSRIFNDIKSHHEVDGIQFFYVSAAPDALYDQDEWLAFNNFPKGCSFLRQSILEETYQYKMNTLRTILKSVDLSSSFLFFGDNSSKDKRVYEDIIKEFNIENSQVFIRDVAMTETFINERSENSFLTELDLINRFFFLKKETIQYIYDLTSKRKILPFYTVQTLKRNLRRNYECSYACTYADDLLETYYKRFE